MSSTGFRSTGFVVLSIFIHGACVAAIALTPIRTVSSAGEKIEVQMGEPAEKPGVAEAPPAKEESKPQVVAEPAPQPKAEVKPVPKPEPVAAKPEPVKPAPVKTVKATPKPAKTVAAATVLPKKQKVVEAADPVVADKDTVAAVAPTEEKSDKEEPKEILMPVKDTVPAGVEAATDDEAPAATEAKSADVAKAADPSPVAPVAVTPAAAAASATPANSETGDLAKGGASKEGAISYLDLKQLPGNKSPKYPMQARLDKRQGNLELLYRVTKEGKVADIQVAKSSGFKDLDSEAVKAISQFKFVPGQEGWARHPVSFNLKGAVTTLPSQLRGKGAQVD